MSKTSASDGGAAKRSPVESGTLDAVFSSLAHPARRRILIVLYARGGEMTAGEINDRFKHSWPTTTRHLEVLRKAGLVAVTESGRNRFYSLRTNDLARAGDWLCGWAKSEEAAPAARAAWADLPYATMRNASPPKASRARARPEDGKKRGTAAPRKRPRRKKG